MKGWKKRERFPASHLLKVSVFHWSCTRPLSFLSYVSYKPSVVSAWLDFLVEFWKARQSPGTQLLFQRLPGFIYFLWEVPKPPAPSPRLSIQRQPRSVPRVPLFMTLAIIITLLLSCKAWHWYYQDLLAFLLSTSCMITLIVFLFITNLFSMLQILYLWEVLEHWLSI